MPCAKAMPEFRPDRTIPAEVRDIALPLCEQHAEIVPPWCGLVTIGFDPDDAEARACVITDVEYRRAKLWIGPLFLNLTPAERSDVVRHELQHIVTEPFVDLVRSIIAELKPHDKALARVFSEELRRVREATVVDLSRVWTI